MIERLTAAEMLTVNGQAVTAIDLAQARQQLAHIGVHTPTWDELTPEEQAPGIVAAAAYLRSLALLLGLTDGRTAAERAP